MAVLTTARKPTQDLVKQARALAATYTLCYVERGNSSLTDLVEQYSQVLVLGWDRLSCHTRAGELFFHPNMAAVRTKQLANGQVDRMLEAMALAPGDRVLDCTAGLCADSLVAAYWVGEGGRVVALEKSPLIYAVVSHGLARLEHPPRLAAPARRIELINTDFRPYLASLPAKSFDVVYFDPMFAAPVKASTALTPLRPLASHHPLSQADIDLARRVARKAVVVKERSFFNFSRLGLTRAAGSASASIAYGLARLEEK